LRKLHNTEERKQKAKEKANKAEKQKAKDKENKAEKPKTRGKSKGRVQEKENEVQEETAVERAHQALMMERQIVKFIPEVHRLKQNFWTKIDRRVRDMKK
jgi:predicted component of type VI protein secretion system